jgi:hypothetical protein
VNDRLADLYALAQGEVLEDVRCPLSGILIVDDGFFQVLAITTIKTAMLVFGIMEISMDPRVEKNRTHHLKLEPVWDAAHRYVG